MNNTCLITGSNGYIGKSLSNFLEINGWHVIRLQRNPKENSQSVSFSLGELDINKIPQKIDVVIHCAHDFNNDFLNINGAVDLYSKVILHNNPKIIYISSISTINGCNSKYASVKSQVENITKEFGGISLRLGLVYGPNPGGMYGRISNFIKSSFLIPVIGDGKQKLYTTLITDLENFIISLLKSKNFETKATYSCFNKDPISLIEIIHSLISLHNKKIFFIIKIPPNFLIKTFNILNFFGFNLNFKTDNVFGLMNLNYPNGLGHFHNEFNNFSKYDVSKLTI